MKKMSYISASIVFCIITGITPALFAQDEVPVPPSEKMIQEMLSDKGLPEDVKRELREMLKEGASGGIKENVPMPRPAQVPPSPAGEGQENAEQQQVQAAMTPSAQPNKITLDLKGVDIIDVLKMLSSRSNLNIVAGRNVRGRVTLFLKDVDVWDAFEIILAANDLAYEQRGDIINVMTERDYEQLYGEKRYNKTDLRIIRLEHAKAATVSKALNQAKSKIGKVIIDEGSNTIVLVDSAKAISEMEKMIAKMDMPVETKVFSLDYAKAEDVKTKISELLTAGVGTIQVDERTNKIVITELSKKMPEIASIITEMDEKHKEVLIETKIVEIELNDQYQYGVDWTAVFRKFADEGITVSMDNISGDVFSSGATGGALTVTSLATDYFDGAIEALKTIGKTNVISSPRLTVLNNEEAKVLVGTNQPYVTTTTTVPDSGSSITAESVTFIDVGVELTVTPTINKDDFVTMKIKPKVSSLGTPIETNQGNDIPVVSTSETETTVMVKDGNTIVIAGLIEDRDEKTENKIPVLGDIPLIGPLLFGNKTTGSDTVPEKKELVVFLTPYVIHGTEFFPEKENTWFGDAVTQRDLLEKQMSMAVEEAKRRSLYQEPRLHEEKKDLTTKVSEGLEFFKKRDDIRQLKEKQAKLREEMKEPEKEGVVPEKVVTKDKEKTRETIIPPANLVTPAVSGYYSYFENLRNRIYWIAKDMYPGNLKGKRKDAEILFTLSNDGALLGEPDIVNEVDKKIALAAKEAVEKAAPFPPFPKRMEEEQATFRITITYQ